MKSTLFLLLLLLTACYTSTAQIDISNSQNSLYSTVGGNAYGANGTYTLNNSFTFPGLTSIDAGTNQYVNGGHQFESLYFYRIIRRVSNLWSVSWAYTYLGTQHQGTLFQSVSSSTDIDPPCNDSWNEYLYNPQNNTTTGIQVNFALAGTTCIPLPTPILATIMSPNSISLPQLTNSLINATPNPQAGMMVWSLDDSCIKVYNGSSWNCL